ncbi:MAG: hypothetical protein ACYC27_12715 [Armatimonadota bacterium]
MSNYRMTSRKKQITVGIVILLLAIAVIIPWRIYSKATSTAGHMPAEKQAFKEELITKLDNLDRVEIIVPKAGPHVGHYLVDTDPDDALVVGTISADSKDLESFRKELGYTLETAGKRKIIRAMLSNTWIRMIFDDGTFTLAMFFTHEDDFIIHDNKLKGSTVEPVYIHCQSTSRLRKMLRNYMD